jgi:hypothetical protein
VRALSHIPCSGFVIRISPTRYPNEAREPVNTDFVNGSTKNNVLPESLPIECAGVPISPID